MTRKANACCRSWWLSATPLGQQNQRLLRTVERVDGQANHIVDILRTQRSFGRHATRKSVNLRQTVESVLKILREGVSRRGIRTHLNFGNVPEEIWVEESQFQQMLVNLFKNAMEATDEPEAIGRASRARPALS